jgi:hypothetical protein
MASSSLEYLAMKRIGLVALVPVLLLAACASSSANGHYSIVPPTQVTVREAKRKAVTYQVRPDVEPAQGAGSDGTSR